MTKLEKKLQELGYIKKSSHLYTKYILIGATLSIHLNKINNMILKHTLTWDNKVKQHQVNNQLDIEMEKLKEYENKNI